MNIKQWIEQIAIFIKKERKQKERFTMNEKGMKKRLIEHCAPTLAGMKSAISA